MSIKLGPNDHSSYCGYTIKRKQDMRDWEKVEGYVVTKGIVNVMPGATWFCTVEDAITGIAALELAKKIAPKPDGDGCDSQTFWHLLQLSKH